MLPKKTRNAVWSLFSLVCMVFKFVCVRACACVIDSVNDTNGIKTTANKQIAAHFITNSNPGYLLLLLLFNTSTKVISQMHKHNALP